MKSRNQREGVNQGTISGGKTVRGSWPKGAIAPAYVNRKAWKKDKLLYKSMERASLKVTSTP